MTKGKVTAAVLLAATLALGTPGTVLAQAQGSNGTGNAPAAAPADSGGTAPAADAGGLGDGEKQALGCGIAATGAMLATYVAGPTEITLLWGGGMLFPSTSTTLALSLLGQIGASFCAIGAVATPTVLWAYDQSDNITAKVFQTTDRVGRDVMEASRHAGASVLAGLGLGGRDGRQVADRAAASVQ